MVDSSVMRALLLSACALSGACGVSWTKAPKQEARAVDFTVGRRAFDRLSAAQRALSENDAKGAYAALGEMRKYEQRYSAHERALMWQMYAHVYASLDQVKDAVECVERALALDALPAQATLDLRYNLGQLLLAQGQAERAADVLQAWLRAAKKPSAEARRVVAVAAAQAGRFEDAYTQIEAALDQVESPPESWLQLRVSIQLQLQRYEEAARSLEGLLARFPKKTYWLQLAGVYGELGRLQESVAVMEILERQGELTERDEVLRLARLYLQQELPLKAAQLLGERLAAGTLAKDGEVLELLANAWLIAREDERALEVLQEGAAASDHGRFDYRYAQLLAEQEAWSEAGAALERALKKGGLRSPGEAYMLLGTVRYNAGQRDAARRAFELAARSPDRKELAMQWLHRLR